MYHCNWYLKAILPLPYSDVNTRVKRPGVSLDSTVTAAAAAAAAAAVIIINNNFEHEKFF